MAKLLGGTDPVFSEIGEVTQGLGFELLGVDDSPTGGTVTINFEDILLADSFEDQLLPDPDIPIQVTFGGVQVTPIIEIDALGNITFLEADDFQFRVHFAFGRTGAGGQASILFGRMLLNGVQVGVSVSTEVDDGNDVNVDIIFDSLEIDINDVVTCEIYRENGNASNGLIFHSPTLGGWNDAPSAEMHIFRFVAVAT